MTSSMELGRETDMMICLDSSKTFDIVYHDILICKVKNYRLDESSVKRIHISLDHQIQWLVMMTRCPVRVSYGAGLSNGLF